LQTPRFRRSSVSSGKPKATSKRKSGKT
jgi:hypothetical protein